MKKMLYTAALLITTLTQAQFKYTPNNGIATINNYAVLNVDGTAEELEELTIDWAKKTFESTKDIEEFLTTSDGYVKIKAYTSGQIASPIGFGFAPLVYVSGYYTLEFRFKDGKIKMDLSSFKHKSTTYVNGITVPIRMNYKSFAVANSRGKLKVKRVQVAHNIAKFFNGLATSLENHKETKQNNQDDW